MCTLIRRVCPNRLRVSSLPARGSRPVTDRVVAGVGASSNAPIDGIVDAILAVVGADRTLVSVATIDTKADVLAPVAAALGVSSTSWTAEQLNRVSVPNPSARVRRETGTASVAEAAATLGSGGGRVVTPKTNIGAVSIALACAVD
ncbi:cobalamin biosynthesis protein [Rhodococcus sp. BP-252]|nr:cobalamin biosynthesis protein [Rhodococcus sp. BP-320]MBY6415749.1 cobalamin biosynthesis protein [Rhodococcus sp. BP-321]MBY6420869.1 cobalamin biosynthesis protein [Rhodococcus sp. BP-324]MBY6425924.1 cobalamin biosynthesis protein [Rhodococcus sp. BP-323]MBY6430955.1 cobalamin biosynthesis protein [Rhodococcus sp. BP-322]MBY6440137.1 cobalamin biosynthesis protein [Rhodococcus sp. BP-319]MBY6444792.1 cobalamin biosynthesis protein [Rhodococcus sp. BP-318]MBY6449842.1 cobalamin biosynt